MENRLDFLTEDEVAALNEPEPKVEEPGPTPEPVETKEPSPPEPGKPEEPAPARKEGEEPPVETKPGEEPAPAKAEEPTPPIDGILTKDGKHFMPFGVLEKERAEKQALKTELEELRKRAETPAPAPEPEKKVEAPPPVDFKELAKKFYESEDGAAEVLQSVFEMGKNAGATAGVQANVGMSYDREIAGIKAANTWITPRHEEVIASIRNEKIVKEKINPTDFDALVRVTREAVEEGKKFFNIGVAAFDPAAEREKIKAEVTKEVLQKFNITEPKPTTLSNVRNVNPSILTKVDQVEQLEGVDFEIAYSQLTPAERAELDRRHSL